MPALRFVARAPSNIALIKYMGKRDSSRNIPENASISMTLDSLCTVAELVRDTEGASGVRWVPELPGVPGFSFRLPDLKESARERVVRHVERVRKEAGAILTRHGVASVVDTAGGSWTLRTANTFPEASGIASSASSFAALTLVTAAACARSREEFEKAWAGNPSLRSEFAALSRQGSGSSCRSFGGPWVLWDEETVSVLPSDLPKMAHFVIVLSERAKAVSSSEAHLRVKSSPLWQGRPARVAARIAEMKKALSCGDLRSVARIAWTETWEMHSLFHTSSEPFSYWQPGTVQVLQELAPHLAETVAKPPIVTLDAGPNVHVIVEQGLAAEWGDRLAELCRKIPGTPALLRDQQGAGGSLL